MKADDLYSALAGNAWKLAAQSTLDADDIRQEMFLICMEVAEGRSAYSPLVGNVHEYIMGRLWGLIRKWPRTYSIEDLIGNVSEKIGSNEECNLLTEFIPVALHAPSVDDVLEKRAALFEQDAIDIEETRQLRERMTEQSTLLILIQTGYWSTREAAKFCGVSRNAIEKRVKNNVA